MNKPRIVRRVDHVFVAVEGAEGVFDMLTDRLGLSPLMPVTDWGVKSGSLSLGNSYLEVLEAIPWTPKSEPGALEVNGLGFEPEPVDDAIAELDRRDISHLPPMRLEVPEGGIDVESMPGVEHLPIEIDEIDLAPGAPMFTNVMLSGLIGGNVVVFCSQSDLLPVTEVRNVARQLIEGVSDRLLPIDGLAEVVVGSTDPEAELERWRTLLDPTPELEPGLWRFDDGPALRIIEHDRDAVVGLKLHVSSLERAEAYLKDNDLFDSSSGNEVVIDPQGIGGLNLSLAG